MKRKITFIIMFALMAVSGVAQKKPGWVYNKPTPENSSYIYVVESAMGTTDLEARNAAFARVFQSTAMRLGMPVNSEDIQNAVQSGKDFNVISAQYNIPINKVCEFTEKTNNGYRVYILCQVAKNGGLYTDFTDFNGCSEEKQFKNSTALIMSIFVPGLGQMGKRRYGEGTVTLLGELALVGGGVSTWWLSKKQLDVMKNMDVSYNDFMKAKKNYQTFRTISYVCYGTAAALYVFNLYRAYAVQPRYKKDIAFYPSVNSVNGDMAIGLGFTYKF